MADRQWYIELDYSANPSQKPKQVRDRLHDEIDGINCVVHMKGDGARVIFSEIGDATRVRMNMDGNVVKTGRTAAV